MLTGQFHDRHLVDHPARQIGAQHPGGLDRRHLDPALGLHPQRVGEHRDGGLGGAVHPGAGDPAVAVDRGDVDHMAAALVDHLVVDRADSVDHALDVDVDGLMPPLPGAFVIGEVGQRHHPGVVDEHVHSTEGAHRLSHGGLQRGQIGDVGHLGQCLCPGGGDPGGHFIQPLARDVDTDHPGPVRRAFLRDQAAESAGRTGDHDDLAGQVCGHDFPSRATGFARRRTPWASRC